MAIADLIFPTRPSFRGLVGLGRIELDCSISEDHSAGVRLSPYPVEGGAELNDHIEDLPGELVIEGVISDSPLLSFGPVSASGFDLNRSKTAWEQLVRLMELHLPFTVATSLKVYTNYYFADGNSLSATKSFSTSKALMFTARVQKWRTSYTTFAESVAAEVADVAASEAANATQATTEAASATAEAAAGAV